jgi:hypothetical protein
LKYWKAEGLYLTLDAAAVDLVLFFAVGGGDTLLLNLGLFCAVVCMLVAMNDGGLLMRWQSM